MNKYEKIFALLVEAVREDMWADINKEIYVLPDGFKVDMAEVERAEAMYKEVK